MRSIIDIQQYPHYPLPPVIASYRDEGVDVKRWNVCRCKTREFPSKGWLVRLWLLTFVKWIFRIARLRDKMVFATAAHLPLLAIAKLFGRAMGDYKIYLDNFYLHDLGRNRAVKRVLAWLIGNRRVTIFVYSKAEVEYFRSLSPLPEVYFIPFCSNFTPITGDLPADFPFADTPYIFTGGYSNRDYDLIIQLAREYPDEKFVVVASSLNRLAERKDIPTNLKLYTDLPTSQFESLLAASWVVIIPLKQDVGASGQMLAISALRNAKPTIFTDLPVISYFFTSNPDRSVAGIPYEVGNFESLDVTLAILLASPEYCFELSSGARIASSLFTLNHQVKLYRSHIHPTN